MSRISDSQENWQMGVGTALIVGAGIGGVAAGLVLRRAGWDVRIFERAATPREIGFGLGLAPNAIAALRDLGVAGAVLSHAVTSA
jgi:2-polyprenyl-6-methoxyphenol hydroxylase-like FAD-dependent oxidoreductase